MTVEDLKPLQQANKVIDSSKYLDDTALAITLLKNAKQNDGILDNADIVFSLRNF